MLSWSAAALAAQMSQTPLAMAPEAAATAYDALSNLGVSALARGPADDLAAARPYELADGIATIRLHGQIVKRASWLSDLLGMAAYDRFRACLATALADLSVRGVVLDIDSPGGEVAGATETAAFVRSANSIKPIVAFVDGLAGSAACVVASAANRVVVTPSSTIGSIGVAYLHLDRSAAYAKRGVKPTVIQAGKYKSDGSGHAALEDGARKRLQALIDASYDLLVESVGRHRPSLGASGARATEAGLYMGQKAVAAKLADAVGTIETARAFLFPSSAAPAAPQSAYGLLPASYSPGAQTMPEPLPRTGAGASALPSFIPAAPYLYAPEAVLKASKRAQRAAKANEMFARQLRGQSVDETWRQARHAASGHDPRVAKPSAATKSAPVQNPDETWRDIMDGLPKQ